LRPSWHSDGFPGVIAAGDIENNTALPIIGTQSLADVNRAGRHWDFSLEGADFIYAAAEHLIDREAARDIVPIFGAGAAMDDAAVVFCGEEADGGQCTNDAVLGAAESFQVDAGIRGDFAGLGLCYELSFAA
jgi:hypothetical protein